ncbi:MAG: hypothetical protein GY851_12425 [bacterium]|nr:hypothetical protein [bacterium]
MRVAPSIIAAVAALTVFGGCRTDSADRLPKAEELYLAQRYDEAIPLLRQHLVVHPDDAAGHFYLGSCYMLSSDPWMVLAQGEIETALAIFERTGKKSPIDRFTDTYFELRCHLELAKILFKQVIFLADENGPPRLAAMVVERLEETLERVRKIDPSAPEVAQLEGLIARVHTIPGLRLTPDAYRGRQPRLRPNASPPGPRQIL